MGDYICTHYGISNLSKKILFSFFSFCSFLFFYFFYIQDKSKYLYTKNSLMDELTEMILELRVIALHKIKLIGYSLDVVS